MFSERRWLNPRDESDLETLGQVRANQSTGSSRHLKRSVDIISADKYRQIYQVTIPNGQQVNETSLRMTLVKVACSPNPFPAQAYHRLRKRFPEQLQCEEGRFMSAVGSIQASTHEQI